MWAKSPPVPTEGATMQELKSCMLTLFLLVKFSLCESEAVLCESEAVLCESEAVLCTVELLARARS